MSAVLQLCHHLQAQSLLQYVRQIPIAHADYCASEDGPANMTVDTELFKLLTDVMAFARELTASSGEGCEQQLVFCDN